MDVCLHTHLCTMCMPEMHRVSKTVLDPLPRELQKVVSRHAGAYN